MTMLGLKKCRHCKTVIKSSTVDTYDGLCFFCHTNAMNKNFDKLLKKYPSSRVPKVRQWYIKLLMFLRGKSKYDY